MVVVLGHLFFLRHIAAKFHKVLLSPLKEKCMSIRFLLPNIQEYSSVKVIGTLMC